MGLGIGINSFERKDWNWDSISDIDYGNQAIENIIEIGR